MPATLKNLMAETAVVSVPVGDDTMTVEYRTHTYDQATEDDLAGLRVDGKGAAISVEMARRVIVSWDLKADEADEDPIPLTDEGLRHVPISILSLVFEAIGEDRSPNPKTSRRS